MAATRMMSSSALRLIKTAKVHDNVNQGVLYINFNSHAAEVEYEKYGDVYDLVHTSIPEEYQGEGLGTVFAERIFDHLVQKRKKIKLTCEFLEKFYSKNVNKYQQFVVEG
jgi:predicted GNAT family acetyltransferase